MGSSIDDVLRRHEPELLSKDNVTSAGLGEERGEQFIVVFVHQKLPKDRLPPDQVIPRELEGYRVDVQEQLLIG